MNCSWPVHDFFMPCLRLVQKLCITRSWLVHCLWLVYNWFTTVLWLVHHLFITCLWHVHYFFRICSLLHYLVISSSLLVLDLFMTCSWLFQNFFTYWQLLKFYLLMNCSHFIHSFKFLHLHFFSRLWLTSLTQLPFNYFNLFPSLEVLCFSHLPRSKFTKRNKLNRLVGLSLAQLSPSLFSPFFELLRHP